MLAAVSTVLIRLDDATDRANRYALILLVAIMSLTVFLGVASRWFEVSVAWTQEVSEFAFVWLSLMGTVAVFKRKAHIVVDAANALMPETVLKGVKFIGEAAMIVFFSLLTVAGIDLALINYSTVSPVLEMSVGLHYLSIPLASLLIILNQLGRLFAKMAQA